MVRPPNPNQGHEASQWPSPGPSSVLEYQASGLPYVTASTVTGSDVVKIEFPFVTKFFTIKNNGPGDLAIGFTANGVALGTNIFTVPMSSSFTGDIRLADLFLGTVGTTSSYEVIAGLTQIIRKNWFILTGALNGFSGSGPLNGQQAYGHRGFGYSGIG